MEEYIPLNFRILLQPLNWLIVLLMLAIAGFALETAYTFAVSHFAANNTVSEP